MAAQPRTRAIERAAQLLVHVVESPRPLAVGELAEATRLPKSTTSRLIGALERQGLVQRVGGVRAGPVLVRLAQRGLPEEDLLQLADPALRRLADASGETINLAVPTPLGVEHLAQRDSHHFVGVTSWVGRRVPLHASANGKVFLAHGTAPLPAGGLERLTPRTLVDRVRLEAELETIRSRGYAAAVDELEVGLSALAAPVRRADGAVAAALSISGPTIRLTRARIDRLAPVLLEQAHGLSERLGYDGRERVAVGEVAHTFRSANRTGGSEP